MIVEIELTAEVEVNAHELAALGSSADAEALARVKLDAYRERASDGGDGSGGVCIYEGVKAKRLDVIGFVQGVIDSDAHAHGLDAIDVAGIVNAMMRGEKYMIDAADSIVKWSLDTFGIQFTGRIFEVRP